MTEKHYDSAYLLVYAKEAQARLERIRGVYIQMRDATIDYRNHFKQMAEAYIAEKMFEKKL